MPKYGKREFAYTKEGIAEYKKAKRTGTVRKKKNKTSKKKR
jgi:hypothetical protein